MNCIKTRGLQATRLKSLIPGILLSVAVGLGGCATPGPRPHGGAVGSVIRESGAEGAVSCAGGACSPLNDGANPRTPIFSSGARLEVWGQRLKNSRFDLPVLM